MKYICTLLVCLLTNISTSYAGTYSNDLGKCLVESTSTKDRNSLVAWMFSAASQHPAVKHIVSVSDAQLETANKDYAELSIRLLTKDCKTEAEKAVKFEGPQSIESSFALFGQVAGRELFSSPHVAKAMAGYAKYFDNPELDKLFKQ